MSAEVDVNYNFRPRNFVANAIQTAAIWQMTLQCRARDSFVTRARPIRVGEVANAGSITGPRHCAASSDCGQRSGRSSERATRPPVASSILGHHSAGMPRPSPLSTSLTRDCGTPMARANSSCVLKIPTARPSASIPGDCSMSTIIYRNSDNTAIGKTIGNVIRLVDMSALGDRVRQIRKERGWTQMQLAKKAKIPQSSVSTLESGSQKGSPHIVEIALALGVNVYWLRSGRGPKLLTKWQEIGQDLSEAEQDLVERYLQLLRAGKVA